MPSSDASRDCPMPMAEKSSDTARAIAVAAAKVSTGAEINLRSPRRQTTLPGRARIAVHTMAATPLPPIAKIDHATRELTKPTPDRLQAHA
ncbi:MAG: hypothetical protein C4317_01575 [Acidimicrobiia bacterium]